jgi:NAD(P)-dependent dehydrogenase (short-subunit alcohol dehydrogenase family)
MDHLSGKTILVTGASRGIGASIAHELSGRGAHVIAQYNTSADGAEEATAAASERLLVAADFSDPAAATSLWETAVNWRGRIDAVVCNAAVMPEVDFNASADEWNAAWHLALQVNTRAPSDLTRLATQHHLDNGGGVIVGISSWAAQRGSSSASLAAYSASKAGYAAMLKTVARAYAADNVLAYLIAPGVVQTEMSVTAAASSGGVEKMTAALNMKEWVPPTEIATLVGMLCEGRLRHLTGATLDVNGASYVR